MNAADLKTACRSAGIATRYRDGDGIEHRPGEDALRAVLEAVSIDIAGSPPIIVAADRASHVATEGSAGAAELIGEDGSRTSIDIENGLASLPPLDVGYYRLECGGTQVSVLATPARTYCPAPWPRGKAWGLQAQLYGLRRNEPKAIGDLGDLAELGRIAEEAGASFVGINPLHALFPHWPDARSPYSPSSRLFLNPIYLDLSKVPGAPVDQTIGDLGTIDYADAWKQKLAALSTAYQSFEGDPAFDDWRAGEGEALKRHALFEALTAHHDDKPWREWPSELHDPTSPAVAAFATANEDAVRYSAWLQWHCAKQLKVAANATPGFGLYRDLAVGADRAGSEYWGQQSLFAATLDVGAPPDGFSPNGQNWGLPPLKPATLHTEAGLDHFRQLIGSNMRGSGLLRIDHAFQLERLFVVPHGFENRDGTYIAYPLDLLLAVLKIESHRHRCVVVAEDLGTAPDGFRDVISDAGLLTYKVFYFERDGVAFTDPADWDRMSFASISTHDLPTLKGWWAAHDVEWRERTGQTSEAQADTARLERAADREALGRTLALPPTETVPADDIIAHVASAGSMLVGVQLEDVIGEIEQANLPGTMHEHPNWQRRLGKTLEEMEPLIDEVGDTMRAAGRDGKAVSPVRSTYRLQFHEGFTFADAVAIVPYLAALGVSHIYASPIFEAEPGSTHGYDGVDPTRVSGVLGGPKGFAELASAARKVGLGIIIDIVPNHLGIASDANPYWWSVLMWGRASPHAATFDIDWAPYGPMQNKITMPVLGESYGAMLEAGDLAIKLDDEVDRFVVTVPGARYPVCPKTYPDILQFAGVDLKDAGRFAVAEPDATPSLRDLPLDRADLEMAARAISATFRIGQHGALHRLLERQHYRLVHWRAGVDSLNYRRFFDITTLAGLRVEDESVFEWAHREVFRLHAEGLIDGVRIDHVDGLADPTGYLKTLRKRMGPDAYIVVEKILEHDEVLRPDWPVDGTSGYDALNAINGLFVDRSALETFDALDPTDRSFDERLKAAKRQMLDVSFRGEVAALVKALQRGAREELTTRDLTHARIEVAVRELLVAMPVYRTYIAGGVTAADKAVLDMAFAGAEAETRGAITDVLSFVRTALETDDGEITRRFQQLGGPVMAKGLEDTLFYRDPRLISLNEVGGAPQTFGHDAAHLHRWAVAQARDWPNGIIATATHDTKRGEDARARVSALTHHPGLWMSAVQELDVRHAESGVDETDRRIFYQAVLGAWSDHPDQIERLQGYAEKAVREAKRHSTWTEPNTSYEADVRALMAELGAPESESGRIIANVVRRIAPTAMHISLGQLVLKHTLPGVPDTYQGTELADYSLVDPDNRRPVDYGALRGTKAALTKALLALRTALHPLFTAGTYEPVEDENGVAFRRRFGGMACEVRVSLDPETPPTLSDEFTAPSPGSLMTSEISAAAIGLNSQARVAFERFVETRARRETQDQ